MIIKMNQLHRYASELLAKELLETPNYTFTNSSYGGNGSTLATIVKKVPHEEHTIQYNFIRKGNYSSKKYELVRETEDKLYATKNRECSKVEDSQVIKTVWYIDDDIYTDDEEYANSAIEKRKSRYTYTFDNKPTNVRERTIFTNDKLYQTLFAKVFASKKIKYGTPLTMHVYTYNSRRYEFNPIYREVPIKVIETSVHFNYRNKQTSIRLNKTQFDTNEVDCE